MSDRRRWRPRLEPLEARVVLSAGGTAFPSAPVGAIVSQTSNVNARESSRLQGTLHGTFFRHGGKAQTIENVYASGPLAPVGRVLLVGGFQATRAGGSGNLLVIGTTTGARLTLHLTALRHPMTASSRQDWVFAYRLAGSRGTSGTGTVAITFTPVATNIRGIPVSNPGFYGNATLIFGPRV